MPSEVDILRKYYADPAIQMRIAEFFGGSIPDEASAIYFTAGTEEASNYWIHLPLEELQSWMRRGAEINRSLWDRRSLVAHLDIEYVNFDDVARPFQDPTRIFELQRPVIEAVEGFLDSFGIHPLHVITGRGHHYVWGVSQESDAFARLTKLGHVSASLQRLYAVERAPTGELVDPALGAAFAGLALLVEFIAHYVKQHAAPLCQIPVEFGAIEVGTGAYGRELIALDITEYADPLCSRTTRVPFSAYLKRAQNQLFGASDDSGANPTLFVVPLAEMSIPEALALRCDAKQVRQLAKYTSSAIPDASGAMLALVAAYEESPLAAFHKHYFGEQHDAPSFWPETYDRTPLDQLPACARHILEHANDLLVRPGCVQRIVRVLLALGWHPRHIGGLIRSKYERDYGWSKQWQGFDPATRADFYARVFSALIFMGVDNLVDFNCQSAREEGLCFVEGCTCNLQSFRNALLDRRFHERLASRPLHGLLLPEEYL